MLNVKFLRLVVAKFALFTLAFSTTAAQTTVNADQQAAIKAAKRMIDVHMKGLNVPGMQLAVVSNGRLICSESFGFSDLAAKRPVTENTAFRIGSISKSLTTAALGRLVDSGKLKLDAPISIYLPTLPKHLANITVRQLADHTSGIRHYRSAEEASSAVHYDSVSDALTIFKNDPLLFPPGTRMEYSSFGYVLLSAVLEAASKMKFPDLMKTEIFDKLDLRSTTMDLPGIDIPFRSKHYVEGEKDDRVLAPAIDNSSKWASGGMISSAKDLALFGSAMLERNVVSEQVAKTLFTAGKTADGKETSYALGWQVTKDADGRSVIVNDGSLPSTRAVLALYPDQGLVIAVTANTGQGVFFNREEALTLGDIFLHSKGLVPSMADADRAVGDYSYSTFFDGENIVGKISLFRESGELRGVMTVPNSFFKDRQIPAPVIRIEGNEITIYSLPRGNWMRTVIRLDSGGSIAGSFEFGPVKSAVSGTRRLN